MSRKALVPKKKSPQKWWKEEEKSSIEEEKSSVEEKESNEEESSESFEEEKKQEISEKRKGQGWTEESAASKATKAQISARKFLSRKLATFSGSLEEWPMFISNYETSTKTCDFSHVENLAQLHKCLSGEILKAAKCRLHLPKTAPKIIETLRMMYGSAIESRSVDEFY